MFSDRGLRLEREGDALILRSRNTARWFLAPLFVGMGLVFLVALAHRGLPSSLGQWFGIFMGVSVLGVGLYTALLREVTTTFDLRSRRVVHTVSFAICPRRRGYSFADIDSLGVKERYNEGYTYMPVMTLRNGQARQLGVTSSGYLACGRIIDEICEATGLHKRDIPRRRWWWRSKSD